MYNDIVDIIITYFLYGAYNYFRHIWHKSQVKRENDIE